MYIQRSSLTPSGRKRRRMHGDRKNQTRRARASQIFRGHNGLIFILGKRIGFYRTGTSEEPNSEVRNKVVIQNLVKSKRTRRSYEYTDIKASDFERHVL